MFIEKVSRSLNLGDLKPQTLNFELKNAGVAQLVER